MDKVFIKLEDIIKAYEERLAGANAIVNEANKLIMQQEYLSVIQHVHFEIFWDQLRTKIIEVVGEYEADLILHLIALCFIESRSICEKCKKKESCDNFKRLISMGFTDSYFCKDFYNMFKAKFSEKIRNNDKSIN